MKEYKLESQLQADCFKWANNEFKELRGFGISHIPNGENRSLMVAKKLKAMGVRSGIADFMILIKSKAIFIELKLDNNKSGQSKEQKEFELFCNENGFEYYLCTGFTEFQNVINQIITKFKNYE